MSNKFQNEDFKTEAELVSAGGTKAQLLNDTKIYVTANGIAKTLDQAILDGDIGGSGGVGGVDIMATDTADKASLGQYTQVGLEILTSPVILHGTKSFRLIHQAASTRYFTKIIPVDRKFRGKLMTIEIDVVSTALSANLTLLVKNETTPGTPIQVAQQVTTGSQTITATVTSTSLSMTGLSQADFNKLKLGQVITGTGIQSGTTITGLQPATLSATLSLLATSTSTSTKTISALTTKRSFGFLMPEDCLSFSFTISALQEAGAPESYIDDIVIQLLASAMSSTTVTVPKNNDTDPALFVPAVTGAASISTEGIYFQRKADKLICYGVGTINTPNGTALSFALPNSLQIDTGKLPTGTTDTHKCGFMTRINGTSSSIFPTVGQGPWIAFTDTSVANNVVYFARSMTGSRYTKSPGNDLFNTAERFDFKFEVPIVGWKANETETKTIPLTTSVLYTSPDASMTWQGFAGRASVRTMIPYFTNARQMIGNGFSWTTSTTQGLEVTITEDAYFDIHFDLTSGVNQNFFLGLGLDLTDFTSNVGARVTDPTVLRAINTAAGTGNRESSSVNWSGPLKVGQKIYPMLDTSSIGDSPASCYFSVSKIGSTKILNPSKDQKIDIPTHALRFEGSNSRGSTDTAIVKFDTMTNLKGDAWDVINTAANGTVITMKKAGRLQVGFSVRIDTTAFVYATINQTVLTATPTSPSEMITSTRSGIVAGTHSFTTTQGVVDVKIGDKIRISAEATTVSDNRTNYFTLHLQENSIGVALSNVLPQFTQSDSCVQVRTANGYGSVNTRIRRFSNTVNNLDAAITYIDSATLGGLFYAKEDGLYDISYTDIFATAGTLGISKNTTQPSTNVQSIPAVELLKCATTAAANYAQTVSTQEYLLKGDFVAAHTGGASNGADANYEAKFTISKVGKPNLTSVDVTPFVNIKTQDTQAIEANNLISFGSTNTFIANFGTVTKNTGIGILKFDNSNTANGTVITALKDCVVNLSVDMALDNGRNATLVRNANILTSNAAAQADRVSYVSNSGTSVNLTPLVFSGTLKIGDTLRIFGDNTSVNLPNQITTLSRIKITATAVSDSIVTPTQQISSDALPFTFKATAIVDADPIGTFNTYTYAANTNTATISASAPTQTVASMNTDGFRLFARAYNAASTTASPARVDIKIGKGLKATQVNAYASAAKTSAFPFDRVCNGSLSDYGTDVFYSETSGVLTINAGLNTTGAITVRSVDSAQMLLTSGYFVFNASTSPSITALPVLQPRIAYLSDVKASGTAGGSTAAATTQTRVLNTLVDSTGIVTSLVANQFTLPAGTYSIEASAPAYRVTSHKIRIRNITDVITSLIGTSEYTDVGSTSSTTRSLLTGELTITSTKTFELQHYTVGGQATNGLGPAAVSGESEIYSQVKITLVRK